MVGPIDRSFPVNPYNEIHEGKGSQLSNQLRRALVDAQNPDVDKAQAFQQIEKLILEMKEHLSSHFSVEIDKLLMDLHDARGNPHVADHHVKEMKEIVDKIYSRLSPNE